MTDDFFQEISNTGNPFEYADNVRRYQTQLPLGISWPTMTGSLTPRDLYSDDNSIYMYYPSGLNKTAIEIQQRDRFGGVTFTLLSGSVNLFIQASEYFADPNPAFISAPYTLSGESGTDLILASYVEDTPNNPENYWINLPSPGTYKVVFPNPVVSTALTVTHSGSSPYIFSQMLPRKSVGGYDIDVNAIRAYHVSATLIDTIALQVADSIVVGPELIGAKSIDGSKIIDGTISGVLIRDGTVTGNKVLAGTISGVLLQGSTITGDKILAGTIDASKLTVTQLDAVAANMGTLIVNSGISIGTNGTIWAGTGTALAPETGLKIYTTSGISRLTTYANSGEVQVDIGSDGKLLAGAGAVILDNSGLTAGKVKLDSTGLTIGNTSSLLEISDALRIQGSGVAGNIVGMAMYNGAFSAVNPQSVIQLDSTNALEIEQRAVSGIINFNFPDTTATNTPAQLNVYNGSINMRRNPGGSSTYKPGGMYGWDGDGNKRFEVSTDRILLNNATQDTVTISNSTGDIITGGNIETYDMLALNEVTAYTAFNSSWVGSDYVFKVNSDGKLTTKNMGYITVRRTATLAITTAGTTIVWDTSGGIVRSNNISVSTDTITIDNAGYYMFSATFATVANLTSLRMSLTRGTVNYVSTLHGAGLSTGGGYIFNFNIGFWASAGSTYKVNLTPSSNTTLNVSNEAFAAPSPIMNIFQAIGV